MMNMLRSRSSVHKLIQKMGQLVVYLVHEILLDCFVNVAPVYFSHTLKKKLRSMSDHIREFHAHVAPVLQALSEALLELDYSSMSSYQTYHFFNLIFHNSTFVKSLHVCMSGIHLDHISNDFVAQQNRIFALENAYQESSYPCQRTQSVFWNNVCNE